MRHAIAALLDQAGYRTGQARDGREALSKLQQEAVDLLLLDIGLPGMSGLDVLAQIRSQAAPPPVIMMTADDTPETLLQSFRAQAQRFIRKPFPPRRIVESSTTCWPLRPWPACRSRSSPRVPEWVEIVAPCTLEVGERVREFVMQLDATLPVDVRESVAQAFRELLTNAIEWGGHLDPQRMVRISCIADAPHAPLPDRRSWRGLRYQRSRARCDLESR